MLLLPLILGDYLSICRSSTPWMFHSLKRTLMETNGCCGCSSAGMAFVPRLRLCWTWCWHQQEMFDCLTFVPVVHIFTMFILGRPARTWFLPIQLHPTHVYSRFQGCFISGGGGVWWGDPLWPRSSDSLFALSHSPTLPLGCCTWGVQRAWCQNMICTRKLTFLTKLQKSADTMSFWSMLKFKTTISCL